MTTKLHRWSALGAVAIIACSACGGSDVELAPDSGARDGGAVDGSTPPIPGLESLYIEPGSATVLDDGVAPGETAAFQAIGVFEDGERDITEIVHWSLEDEVLGTIEVGEFTSSGIGGATRVVVAGGALTATADLTVVLETVVVLPDAPGDAPGLFPEDTSGDVTGDGDAPLIIYPSHETMFPRNLERVNHQWRAGTDLDLFEVRFDSDVAHVRWYTTDRTLLPDPTGWRWLAATHPGRSLEMTVRGLDTAAPTTVHRSAPVTLYYSRSEVLGALYYWSTGAQGVMRANIASPIATKFFTDPAGDDDTCVSCHTVSRDGRRLAVAYGGERLRLVTVPDRDLRVPSEATADGPEYGWGTFNPGATRLLYANKGALHLLEVETGASLGDVTLPTDHYATHPDWAPNDGHVAIAYGTRSPGNKEVQGSSLARLPVMDDGSLGAPEVLVASTGDDDTIYFPSYSPDSRWIAFVRATGKSKDNRTAELFLVAADGSGEPIALTRLNRRVRHEDGILDIGNSMPTWAPSTTPETFWLAFSSLRAYGDILDGGRDQLWGAAVDPAAIGTGTDAGYAGFWMPFQDLEEGNHRAFWALDTEEECPTTVELCDGLDNDCDGIVDEMCCAPEAEVCGDEIDNDCDGLADEGCGCFDTETCGNGIDDDCDGFIDDMDEDCII